MLVVGFSFVEEGELEFQGLGRSFMAASLKNSLHYAHAEQGHEVLFKAEPSPQIHAYE